jgi:hypothetical protein
MTTRRRGDQWQADLRDPAGKPIRKVVVSLGLAAARPGQGRRCQRGAFFGPVSGMLVIPGSSPELSLRGYRSTPWLEKPKWAVARPRWG